LRYGIKVADFPYAPRTMQPGETVHLLTVGRLVEKKGIEYVVRAIAKLRGQFPNLRYDVIGEGPLRAELEAVIESLGLTDVVTLHGAMPESAVRRMMHGAHIFLLCSVTARDGDEEGTPVALMEAQSCGLPVISTWHSGIPEIVAHGETGFLCQPRDANEIAERLTYLLASPDIWVRMGQKGHERARTEYNTLSLTKDLEGLYQDLLRHSAR
jgi:colanic acid/amylovoran biosynthesis glycosyltransferase